MAESLTLSQGNATGIASDVLELYLRYIKHLKIKLFRIYLARIIQKLSRKLHNNPWTPKWNACV